MATDEDSPDEGSAEDSGGADGEANPVDVQKFLKGVKYPATKQDLIDVAEDNGADEDAAELLESMSDMDYSGPADVATELAKLE